MADAAELPVAVRTRQLEEHIAAIADQGIEPFERGAYGNGVRVSTAIPTTRDLLAGAPLEERA